MKNIIFVAIVTFLVLILIFGNRTNPSVPVHQIDTTVIHDTLEVVKPYPVKEYETGEVIHDTLPGTVDSVPLLVDIPISRKVYADSNYRAVVSGYCAILDSMTIYNKTFKIKETITLPSKPPNKWSVGLTGGWGASRTGLSPFIGIGITYHLILF